MSEFFATPIGIFPEECQRISEEAQMALAGEAILAEASLSGDDPITWLDNAEPNGDLCGEINGPSGEGCGVVVYSGTESPVRISSPRVLKAEHAAQSALQTATAFDGLVALKSLKWTVSRMSQEEGRQTAIGLSWLRAGKDIVLWSHVKWNDEGVRPIEPTLIEMFTPYEIRNKFLGLANGEFAHLLSDNEERVPEVTQSYKPRIWKPGPVDGAMNFGGIQYHPDEDAISYGVDMPLAQRWAGRSAFAGLYTAYGDVVQKSYHAKHAGRSAIVDN